MAKRITMATKKEVIQKRSRGLKKFDHVMNRFGIERILTETVNIHNTSPTTWGPGWPNLHWAFMNAISYLYNTMDKKIRHNGQMAFNLDEVLTKEQLQELKDNTGISGNYADCWARTIEA